MVGEHTDLRHPLTWPTGGRRDHGVDLQLCPRGAGVAVHLTEPADLCVDRGVQGGVTDRVQFEMGVVHAGGLVDPPFHTRPRPLRREFVDVTAGSGGDQVAGQVPALPLERIDTQRRGCLQQQVLVGEELGAEFVVEAAGGVGERIDMTRRHRTARQRIFEARAWLRTPDHVR